ncbi:hypothetical protein AAC387_Pa08g0750 [Persea americana]|eukprot:TRINITY_DN13878_c0_g1_i1.p1 TRINITY_DN13878_c0_g1~~TRINITY_DN13878_c0_g1_i1.p1  ORF type:complete len:444 (+),score=117.92 TRINITY_DN13878_c0_g1_i1:405-1736(+)
MDGNMSGGNLISSPYGVLDIQGSLHPHQQSLHQQHLQDVFPLSMGSHGGQNGEPHLGMVAGGHRNSMGGDRAKNCTSDEDEPSFNEDDGGKGKKNSPWQRMKWTDGMVRLLITIVSYIGEDAGPDSGRRKLVLLQKKGKWKAVSRVMAVRGCYVSPQQCEDKFNDLNKRYKRLTDVLGRGTSCKVVENPILLDSMTHLSEKMKEDVRKILSSKHLFYEEMCSYHNGNRIHLLDDPSIQQCLQLVLNGRDGREAGKHVRDDNGGNDQDEDSSGDGDDDGDENINIHGEDGLLGASRLPKRMRLHHNMEDMNSWVSPSTHECGKRSCSENHMVEMTETMQRQWIRNRMLQLEEQRLNIQAQALELETQRFKWQRFSRKKEKELDKYRLENEKMKLENEQMMLELKKKELELGYNRMDVPMASGSLMMDRLQRREQSEMERGQCMR